MVESFRKALFAQIFVVRQYDEPNTAELDEAAMEGMGGGGPASAPRPEEKKEEGEDEAEISPMLFLANNQQYFDQLFELLNLEGINKDKVRFALRE